MFRASSWESFALFSTDNRFEISVSISLLLQNLPLLVVRVSLCSLQIIALKLACQLRYCYKICTCLVKQECLAVNFERVLNRLPLIAYVSSQRRRCLLQRTRRANSNCLTEILDTYQESAAVIFSMKSLLWFKWEQSKSDEIFSRLTIFDETTAMVM